MNKEVKDQWVAALRSGKYSQGRTRLALNGDYCCLGVLCDLAVKAGAIPEPVPTETFPDGNMSGLPDTSLYFDGAIALLPMSVERWAGLDVNNFGSPTIPVGANEVQLSDINDNLGWDFLQIADAIERYL